MARLKVLVNLDVLVEGDVLEVSFERAVQLIRMFRYRENPFEPLDEDAKRAAERATILIAEDRQRDE